MTDTWLVLLPPLVVLASVFILRNLIPAFILGLISAGLIASDFSPIATAQLLGMRLWSNISDLDLLFNFSFLFAIGILVCLLSVTGGATAFAHSLTNHLRSAKMVEGSLMPLSFILALDDYLNTLTVAYVMRPLTDRFNIARAKLAFLVQSMAGPLVILIPLSSWAALISGQLELSGISVNNLHAKIVADPFFVYLQSIPFIFYSLITITCVWFIIHRRISYGPMHTHETIAQTDGNLFGGKAPLEQKLEQAPHGTGTVSDLLIPMITLLASVLVLIAWFGNYYMFGGNNSLLEAFKNNSQTSLALFLASLITLAVGFVRAYVKKQITMMQIPRITLDGISLMYSAILVVFFASLLGTILRVDLNTGSYLAHLLLGSIPMTLLPLMIFVTSTLVSLSIGSAWGTITLMLPIAIPMFLTFVSVSTPAHLVDIPLLLPILGAVFSGAVVGDHISPVSSAAVMASTSSGAYPLDHAITQIPYALPAVVCTGFSFLATSYFSAYAPWINALMSYTIGIIPCLFILYFLNKNK